MIQGEYYETLVLAGKPYKMGELGVKKFLCDDVENRDYAYLVDARGQVWRQWKRLLKKVETIGEKA